MRGSVKRLGLILVGVGDLAGSGGAERMFSELHQYLVAHPGQIQVSLITDRTSLGRLQATGRLLDERGVIALPLGSAPARGKLRTAWMTAHLLWLTATNRFDVMHVCLPTPTFVPFFAALSRVPAAFRPKLTLNVIDCTLTGSFEASPLPGTYERQVLDAHRLYFRWARLDGVFSWYRNFADLMRRRSLTAASPVVRSARCFFTDANRFNPADTKDRLIVFAARLSEQKRPLLFIEAVARVRDQHPELLAGWRFEMYGKGILDVEVRRRLADLDLGEMVRLTHAIDMAPVFARSRVLVSTQAFENFTSLSMLEAMAAGNAVIAADVGQTSEFVRHGDNGLLVAEESPQGFADALAEYLAHPERHQRMAACSRALVTDVHTIAHFAEDIRAFWDEVIDGGPRHGAS